MNEPNQPAKPTEPVQSSGPTKPIQPTAPTQDTKAANGSKTIESDDNSWGSKIPSQKLTAQLVGYFVLLGLVLIYLLCVIWPPDFEYAKIEYAKSLKKAPPPNTTVRDIRSDLIFFKYSPKHYFRMSVNYDQRLLLMVIVLGTLGSYVHAANSFADYVGNRQLFWSWMPWYALRPLVGAPTAIFLYFVMRAGFLTASASGGDINRFGIGAIAGLSGLFSVKAGDKLKEVFDTLFKTEEKRKDALQKPQDDRGGKLALEITTLNLPDGIVGEAYRHSLRARRGTVPFTWTVTPALPSGLALDSNTGNISGVPTAVSAKSSYRFTVKDSATIAESSAVDLTLEIK